MNKTTKRVASRPSPPQRAKTKKGGRLVATAFFLGVAYYSYGQNLPSWVISEQFLNISQVWYPDSLVGAFEYALWPIIMVGTTIKGGIQSLKQLKTQKRYSYA